jgi:enoyl-[acyl-carrier protein] reductase II
MSQLLEMLGCRYPIVQGPMARLNSPEMVAAISEAGAYGMLALGFYQDEDEVKRLVEAVRKRTAKPFGANIVLMNPHNPNYLKTLADAGVKTVTTSVGNPATVYPIIHDLGMKGIHVVLSLPHAVKAAASGADGLVLAGAEAAGLRSVASESTTMVLVPLVADHVKIPLVAAGGIADARGFRAALALGAQGVQMGTRFLCSTECPAHELWKQAVVNCTDGGTDLVPAGPNLRTRAIITPAMREAMKTPGADPTAGFSPDAWERNDVEHALAGAGQVSALIREIKPVKEIIAEMTAGSHY